MESEVGWDHGGTRREKLFAYYLQIKSEGHKQIECGALSVTKKYKHGKTA